MRCGVRGHREWVQLGAGECPDCEAAVVTGFKKWLNEHREELNSTILIIDRKENVTVVRV